MRFGVIRVQRRELRMIEAASIEAALVYVGLKHGEVDHGTIMPGTAIVVHEHSLFKRPQSFFSIKGRLYGGNAVLYGFDAKGKTVDLAPFGEPILWFADQKTAESAIELKQIERPQKSIGDAVLWKWPDPMPTPEQEQAFIERHMPTSGTMIVDDDTIIKIEESKR